MSFFKNRPLCLFCVFWIIILTIGFFLPITAQLVAVGIGVILLLVLCFSSFIRKENGKTRCFFTERGRYLSALALLLALPLLIMAAYRSFYVDSFLPYEKQDELMVTAEVRSVSYAADAEAKYVIITDTINNNPCRAKLTLTVSSASLIHVGDVICAQVYPVPQDKDIGITERLTAASDGIVGDVIINDVSDVTVTATGKMTFYGFWRCVNERVAQRLLEACGKKQGGLIAAVLLGRKDLLDTAVVKNFARSGVSHILALSGFHVSVIAGAMEWILKKCRIGKGLRMTICSVLLLLFLCLIGFSLSAQRSVIMMFFFFCSRWFYADSDSPTFLSVTVALMMTFFPASVVDVSLWMSFAATFGVLLGLSLIQKIPRGNNPISTVMTKMCSGIVISLFAMICVLPISFLYFGTVAVMAPITTMLAVPISYVLMLGGIIVVVASCTAGAAAAQLLGSLPVLAGRALTEVTGYISQMNGVVYSLKLSFVPAVLLLFFVLFFLWIVVRWEKKWTIVIPFVCVVVLYGISYSVWCEIADDNVAVTYLGEDTSETLLVMCSDKSVMIDVGGGYYSDWREGWDKLEKAGNTELTMLLLTHYHTSEIGSFEKLASRVLIRYLYVPEPTDETEYFILSGLYSKAMEAGVPIFIYQYQSNIKKTVLGDAGLTIYRGEINRSSQPVIALSITGGKDKFVYLGASACEGIENCSAILAGCTGLLLGKHGPSSKQTLDGSVSSCKTLIIPNGEMVSMISDGTLQSLPENCSVFLDTFQWDGQPVSLDNKDNAVIK